MRTVCVGLAAAATPQNVNTEGIDTDPYEYDADTIETVKQYFESTGAEYPLKDAYTDYENKNHDKILFDADKYCRALWSSQFAGKGDALSRKSF